MIITDRFWSKVKKTRGCWWWTAGKYPTGYGLFWSYRKNISAHRFSYITTKGKIPKNLIVLHKCDNRSCVNPDHLFLGTHKQNSEDMVKKNRQIFGSKHPLSKLTEKQVRKIRTYSGKLSTRKIAKLYSVSKTVIINILSRKSWKQTK